MKSIGRKSFIVLMALLLLLSGHGNGFNKTYAAVAQTIDLHPGSTTWTKSSSAFDILTYQSSARIETGVGDWASMTFSVSESGLYKLKFDGVETGHSGTILFEVDGTMIKDATGDSLIVDYFDINNSLTNKVSDLGYVALEAGSHTLKLIAEGANPDNGRSRIYADDLIIEVPDYPLSSNSNFVGAYDLGYNNTGLLDIQFDVTPTAANSDYVIGFADSSTNVSSWNDMAMLIRMNTDGYFDVRNGANYEYLRPIPYYAGVQYHVQMVTDLATQEYGVYITPDGGSKMLLAGGYAFRTGATALNDLGQIILESPAAGDYSVDDITIDAASQLISVPAEKPGRAPDSGITITVNGFTGGDIQDAIDQASPGDEIYLPAGDYAISETVRIDKDSLTLRGAAQLMEVGVVEWYRDNEAPYWNGTPSRLTYNGSYSFDMMVVSGDHVRFEDLSFKGGLADQYGYSSADLRLNGVELLYGDAEVYGCEFFRHSQGLTMLGINVDKSLKVRNSYFYENFRQDSGYGIVSSSYGKGNMDVRDSEFTKNRHSVIGSRRVKMLIANNYFHDDDPVVKEYDIDIHPDARYNGRMIVRDNVIRDAGFVVFHGGYGEVTGNYFGEYTDGPGYHPVYVGPRNTATYRKNVKPHDIYVGRNIDETGHTPFVQVRHYDFEDDPEDPNTTWTHKYFGYNVYDEGVLWESVHTEYPTYDSDPKPMLGDVYITEAGGAQTIDQIETGVWYDLHAMGVDPQGADTISRIGLQLRHEDTAYEAGNVLGAFDADNNYFIETDGSSVYVRDTSSQSAWTTLTSSSLRGLYVDTSATSGMFGYSTDGSHRKHFTIRFKLLDAADPGVWSINGYVKDQNNNLPIDLEYDGQNGWEIDVVPGTQQDIDLGDPNDWTAGPGSITIGTSNGTTKISTMNTNDWAQTSFTVNETGMYRLELDGWSTVHAGSFKFEIDGAEIKNPDGTTLVSDYYYTGTTPETDITDLGYLRLSSGQHTLKLIVVSPNSDNLKANMYVDHLLLYKQADGLTQFFDSTDVFGNESLSGNSMSITNLTNDNIGRKLWVTKIPAVNVGDYGELEFSVPNAGKYELILTTQTHSRAGKGDVALDTSSNVLAQDVSFYNPDRVQNEVSLGSMQLSAGSHKLILTSSELVGSYASMYAASITLKAVD